VPPYSLAELGSPVQVFSSTNEDVAPMSFIDIVVKDEKPQWQTGQMSLQAPDGSSVVLRPSPNDKEKVLIELNDSGNVIEDFWTNGYRIFLPYFLIRLN